MTLVDRNLRRQLTAAMALAMALALLLSGTALAQTSADEVEAVPIDDSCNDVPEDNFTDVPETNTFDDEIECLKAYGITVGKTATTYAPGAGVRRDEMALFIYRLAMIADEQRDEFELPAPADQGFTDIDDVSPESKKTAINTLGEMGVVNGKTATTYEPATFVRRDEMASFINRLQGYIQEQLGGDPDGFTTTEDFFPDDEGNTHEANINGLASVGIVQGKVDGDYDPAEKVNRGQMAAFIMRHVEVNVDNGVLTSAYPPANSSEVSLDADSAEAGSTVTGSVSNPGSVESIALSGCGFSNDTVDVDGDGMLSLTIPSEQSAGSCNLTFTVKRTDGSSMDSVIPFMVTAKPQTFTDAPDLVSASVNATDDTVTYTFDEAANGAAPVVTDFLIYDSAGTSDNPTTVEILSGDQTKVIADYTGAAVDVEAATLATVRDGAVEDAAGNEAYASAAALNTVDIEAGETTAPDLESVSNIRVIGGEVVADFRFDEEIATVLDSVGPAQVAPAPAVAVAGTFLLHTADGTEYDSTTINNVSADDRTLTVAFGGAPTTLPASQVVRGGAIADAVQDSDADGNPQQTEPRTGDPAFSGGAIADRTDTPDLVSVKVISDDEVAFEFDEAVTTAGIVPASFNLYDSSATETDGTAAERSSSNANVVNVTFTSAAVSGAVGASADDSAVVAVSDSDTNLVHELGLQALSFSAGRTGLPDLASVDISVDSFGDAVVVFTFDADAPATLTADDFALVDAQGTRFTPSGAGVVDFDDAGDETVTFSSSAGGGVFTNSEAAAAVIGSVQDDSAAGTDITEGDVTVSRDTSV